jgi:hypothetical protein
MDGGFAVTSWFGLYNIESHADVDGQNKRWFAFFRGAGSGDMQANNFASCCRMVAPGTANLDAPAEAGAFFEPAEQRAAKMSVGVRCRRPTPIRSIRRSPRSYSDLA